MQVHHLTRRKSEPAQGDETLTFVSTAASFDLEPTRSEWSSPSRLHIPRNVHRQRADAGDWGWLIVVALLCVAAAAGVFL